MLVAIHLYNPQIKGQEPKKLKHITLTHWILRNRPVYKRDETSEQYLDLPKNERLFFSPSSQYQINESAQNKWSGKFRWIKAIMYTTWINRRAHLKSQYQGIQELRT
jgi:hypothetical protein